MNQEYLAALAMVGMALLIVAKGDDQMIHVLQGKLHHAGKNQRIAREVFKKHTNFLSVALFVGGLAVLGFAVMRYARENSVALLPAAIGLALLGGGILGRIRSFIAADLELTSRDSQRLR